MEASPARIVQYFDGSKQCLIPLFQRPYSWEARDWNALWTDLMAQYPEAERFKHFMGAIVTVPVTSVPVGVTKHLVIDGQQRLTTIALLLCAVRDLASALNDTATSGIIGDLLINRHYVEPDDLKLVPTQVDRAAYRAIVEQQDLEPYAESQVIRAYRHFQQLLLGTDADDAAIVPAQVLQTVQQALQVVMINLGEADDPYLIFESLNHKGKPLNQADLVRNYVLMRFQHSTGAGGEQERVYLDLWQPMESVLGSATTEFLRHYGMREGRNVRKGDIYTAAKAEFNKLPDSEAVRQQLRAMKGAAVRYANFLEPERVEDIRIAKRLRNMKELDSTVFYPLLIRLFNAVERDDLSVDDVVECLDAIESFHVRRLACAVPTNALNKITLELCLHLPERGQLPYLMDRLAIGSGGRRWPSDAEFHEALVEQQLYPRRRIARFLLVALEEAHSHKEPIDARTASIEHVMPQSLSAAWIEHLGPDWERLHEKWLDSLGNLTLTGYNGELGNATFAVKREKLANTHFELTRPILAEESWGPAQIRARGEHLAGLAVERWARPAT